MENGPLDYSAPAEGKRGKFVGAGKAVPKKGHLNLNPCSSHGLNKHSVKGRFTCRGTGVETV